MIVAEKSAFPELATVFAKTPIATLQAWHAFHVADNAAPYLSKAFADAYFEMHDKTLSGQKQQKVRWKRGVYAVSGGDFGVGDRFGTFGTLGWAVGQLYTAKYFRPEAKAKIEALVVNLKAAYRARLEKLDWMSDATKQEALKKLDTYTIKVGYPDQPRDYSQVVIPDDDLVGDVRRAAAADWAFYVGRLFGPVDRSDWSMTPQTNDAYNGSLRDIVFPAGILQPPIFDANADPAINYGAIGGVIGHELTHGFDDEGPQDRRRRRSARLVDKGRCGKLRSARENAGRAVLRVRAASGRARERRSHDGREHRRSGRPHARARGLSRVAARQARARDRRSDRRPARVPRLGAGVARQGADDFVRKQVVSDPHSPRQFRVNGVVRNIDAWYDAFGVKPGDKLYVAPEDRVRIW